MERAQEKYANLIAKYLAGEIGRKEKGDLFTWVEDTEANKQFFEEMVHLWGASDAYEAPSFEIDVATAWTKVVPKIALQTQTAKSSAKVVQLSNSYGWWRIAAVILPLLLAAWWFLTPNGSQEWIVVETNSGEQKTIELPDGSKVWMNENTSLSYTNGFEPRFVSMEGEAFFDVERLEESPFEILSGSAKTRVLGTSFNVRAISKENFIEVTVETGSVELIPTAKEEKAVKIEAGSSGIFSKENDEIEMPVEQIANASSWKTQILKFEETPMEYVIQSLERHFNIIIETSNPDILHCNFISNFDNPALETVWQMLEFNFPIQVEKEGEIYIISGEGCPLN